MLPALLIALIASEHRFTNGSGVRVRASPSASAAEVARLPIGTVLQIQERSERPETIGGKSDHWYRIGLEKGKTGWVFGAFTTRFEPTSVTKAYVALFRERSTVDATPFADRADLADLLGRAIAGAPSKEDAAAAAHAEWLALRWTLAAIPFPKHDTDPFAGWIRRQGEKLVYSEPAGEWFLNASRIWITSEGAAGTAEAEEIAWLAATTPLPGECEGYAPCYVSILNACEGRYLASYPKGRHAAEAIAKAVEILAIDSIGELEESDRTSLREELAKAKASLSKVDAVVARPALERVDALMKQTK
jgi:hypothetical protein